MNKKYLKIVLSQNEKDLFNPKSIKIYQKDYKLYYTDENYNLIETTIECIKKFLNYDIDLLDSNGNKLYENDKYKLFHVDKEIISVLVWCQGLSKRETIAIVNGNLTEEQKLNFLRFYIGMDIYELNQNDKLIIETNEYFKLVEVCDDVIEIEDYSDMDDTKSKFLRIKYDDDLYELDVDSYKDFREEYGLESIDDLSEFDFCKLIETNGTF